MQFLTKYMSSTWFNTHGIQTKYMSSMATTRRFVGELILKTIGYMYLAACMQLNLLPLLVKALPSSSALYLTYVSRFVGWTFFCCSE